MTKKATSAAPSKKTGKASTASTQAPEFLVDLLNARSPSGFEQEAHAVLDRYMEPVAEEYRRDPLGNRMATLNPAGDPVLMLAGHMDELGLIVTHVDDHGFIYFDAIGGHDRIMIPGRRMTILSAKGPVRAVTGKRAVHLMTPEDRKKVPEMHEIWMDIGAKNRREALERISIGDPVVHDVTFEMLHGSVGIARAFDDKAGCYVVCEVLRRLAASRRGLKAKIVSVATTQEEIGIRGAITAAFAVNPHIGIAVDVTHATDHPDCDKKKYGDVRLGAGPVLARGANINPFVFNRLQGCAQRENIPVQIEGIPGVTGTDARALQITRGGVAAGLVSIPLRYMHTPGELVDLEDVERCIQLLVAFARSLQAGEHGIW